MVAFEVHDQCQATMPSPKVWEAAPLTSPSAALPMLEVLWRVLVESVEQTKAICGPGCGHQVAQPFFWSNKGNGARICTRSGFYSFGVTYFKTTPYTYWMYILHNEYCLKFSSFTMFHPIETGFYHVNGKIIAGNYEYVNHRQNGQIPLLQMQCPGVECQLSVGFSCPFSSGSAVKTW